MKQIFQTYPSRLLLCLLFTLIGGGNFVWGETSTLTFSAACGGSGTADDGVEWTVTSDGKESTYDGTKGIHYGTSSASVQYIKLTTSDISGTITKVVVKASTASGVTSTVDVTVGGTAFGGDPQSLSSSATNYTFNGSAGGEIVVTVTKPSSATKAIYVKSVAVTYEAAPSFTLTATSNDESYGTVSVDGSTITATPADGYRVSTTTPYSVTVGEATVKQSGNTFSVSADADCTVQINFEAIPTYAVTIVTPTGGMLVVKNGDEELSSGDTVEEGTELTIEVEAGTDYNFTNWQAIDASTHTYTSTYTYTVNSDVTIRATFTAKVYHNAVFSVDGVTTSVRTEEGKPIIFPDNPSNKGGKTFVGWVEDEIDGVTDTAPASYVTSADMVDADITFYAVFADVTPGDQTTVEDELTLATTGITGSSYTSWSGKTVTSGSDAVYAGQSAGGNSSIQLRSNNSNSGVITTASGGILKKVTVVWESHTSNGNELQVYGNTSAYTAPTNLYNDANNGDWLGTIVCGTSTELDISGDYSYVGLRSKSGALYLTSITITWSTGTPDTYSGFCTTLPADDRTAVNMTGFTATTSTLVMGVTESTATTVTNDQLGWTAAYTFTSDDTDVATVNASGVITAVGRGTANITATLNVDKEDESYKVGDVFTKSIEITVVNPSHTVAFYANGVKLSEATVQETDSIKIPEATVYEGFAFVGWAEATIDGSQVEKPELATISIMGTSDVTYYAVYAARNVSIGEITKSYGFETSESDEDWTIDGPVSSNEKKNSGSRSGKINTNHSYVTFNQKVKVKEFSFAFTRSSNNNNYNVYVETSTDNDKWDAAETYAMSTFNTDGTFITKTATFDGSAEYYVRFHCYNTTAVRYVDDVTIVYDGELVTYAPYYTTLTKSASVTSAGFATYCSNANLDFTGTGITAYYGTAVGSKLTFKPITKVPANTGVLLVCDGGKTADVPVLSGDADDVTGNILVGVTEATTLKAADYILNVKEIDGEKKAGFFLAGSHTSLAANRAYIPAAKVAGVKSFALDLEDNADGIEETLSDSLLKSENIYNLAGQRLSKMQKGINIVNGKKILK